MVVGQEENKANESSRSIIEHVMNGSGGDSYEFWQARRQTCFKSSFAINGSDGDGFLGGRGCQHVF